MVYLLHGLFPPGKRKERQQTTNPKFVCFLLVHATQMSKYNNFSLNLCDGPAAVPMCTRTITTISDGDSIQKRCLHFFVCIFRLPKMCVRRASCKHFENYWAKILLSVFPVCIVLVCAVQCCSMLLHCDIPVPFNYFLRRLHAHTIVHQHTLLFVDTQRTMLWSAVCLSGHLLLNCRNHIATQSVSFCNWLSGVIVMNTLTFCLLVRRTPGNPVVVKHQALNAVAKIDLFFLHCNSPMYIYIVYFHSTFGRNCASCSCIQSQPAGINWHPLYGQFTSMEYARCTFKASNDRLCRKKMCSLRPIYGVLLCICTADMNKIDRNITIRNCYSCGHEKIKKIHIQKYFMNKKKIQDESTENPDENKKKNTQ